MVSDSPEYVNIALVGTGRYAPVHLGALQKLFQYVRIKYIWTMVDDIESGHQLQQQSDFTAGAEVVTGDEGFEAILRDPEIAGVELVLPPHVGPQFALRAVAAGKVALTEKPVAPSAKEARGFVAQYRALPAPPPWLVGENYRFQTVLSEAVAVMSDLGYIYKIEHSCDFPYQKKALYLSSAWRRDGSALPGGYMTDIAVHEVATLRVVAEAVGSGAPLRAFARSSFNPDIGLSNPDTLVGFVEWQSGLTTSICITVAGAFPRMSVTASGSNGTLDITRSMWNGKGRATQHELTYHTIDPDKQESRMVDIDGMEREVAAFVHAAAAWQRGGGMSEDLVAEVAKGAPEEAIVDLAIVEALLASGRAGGAPAPVHVTVDAARE